MIQKTKILAIMALTFATSSSASFANNVDATPKTEKPNTTVTISVEQFESQQADLGLLTREAIDVDTNKAVKVTSPNFNSDNTIEITPRYELTDTSTAFIGSTRMDDKGFVDYQRSALTPEGRVTEPLESLASIGIRSKF